MKKIQVFAFALSLFALSAIAQEKPAATTDDTKVAQALTSPPLAVTDIRPTETPSGAAMDVKKPISVPTELASAKPSSTVTDLSKPPALKVGDSLTYSGYRSLSDAQNGQSSQWNDPMEVTEVRGNGDVVFLVSKNPGNFRIYNREGNMVERQMPGGVVEKFAPSYEEHAYPLEVGKKYSVKSVFNPKNPDHNKKEVNCKGDGKIIGWEEVTVPAGKFRALRVEVSGWCNIYPAGWTTKYSTVKWLAPEVKMRPVLYKAETSWSGGSSDNIYSLSSLSLK